MDAELASLWLFCVLLVPKELDLRWVERVARDEYVAFVSVSVDWSLWNDLVIRE